MRIKASLASISKRYFGVIRENGAWAVSLPRVLFLGVAPLAVASFLTAAFGVPKREALGLLSAVYAIVAGFLVGLIPLVHSIIGQSRVDRPYALSEEFYYKRELMRIQTLQHLHAVIAGSTLVLVMALAFSCCISLVLPWGKNPEPIDGLCQAFVIGASTIVYFAGVSTLLAFVDVATGVYDAIESHTEQLKQRLIENRPIETEDADATPKR